MHRINYKAVSVRLLANEGAPISAFIVKLAFGTIHKNYLRVALYITQSLLPHLILRANLLNKVAHFFIICKFY